VTNILLKYILNKKIISGEVSLYKNQIWLKIKFLLILKKICTWWRNKATWRNYRIWRYSTTISSRSTVPPSCPGVHNHNFVRSTVTDLVREYSTATSWTSVQNNIKKYHGFISGNHAPGVSGVGGQNLLMGGAVGEPNAYIVVKFYPFPVLILEV
jgi:hypothetical protein